MLYNSNQIQAIIPHRYPFLLIDTIEIDHRQYHHHRHQSRQCQ